MRDSSGKPVPMSDGNTGYWFSLGDASPRPVFMHKREPSKPVNFPALVAQWAKSTQPSKLLFLADQIGVSPSSLVDLQCCYAEEHKAFAFPMSDGFGNIVGIRFRNFLGDKWAMSGSRNAIFLPQSAPDKMLTVCEGPTETAAALTMGLFAVGRASCSTGGDDIIHFIGRRQIFKVLIIANNDNKHRPDGSPWNPGLEGALKLQEQLPVPSCIVTLPCKDLRDGIKLGFTSNDLEYLVRSMTWKYPSRAASPATH